MSNNISSIASAYNEATKRLRRKHIDDFHAILTVVYEERGITVKRRLRGERKVRRDLEKAVAAASIKEEENNEERQQVSGVGVFDGPGVAPQGE